MTVIYCPRKLKFAVNKTLYTNKYNQLSNTQVWKAQEIIEIDKYDASGSLIPNVLHFQSVTSWDHISKQTGIIPWVQFFLFCGWGETESLGALSTNGPTVSGWDDSKMKMEELWNDTTNHM